MAGTESNEFADFLPDYVAECDEHLTSARSLLYSLESAPDRVTRSQLDQLFRDFHTIKGLSGMGEVREAERLAHHLETYLGEIRKGKAALTGAGVNLLIEGVVSLEGIVAALRDRLPPPSVDALMARAAEFLPESSNRAEATAPRAEIEPSRPAGAEEEREARLQSALLRGWHVWRVTFSPSAAGSERGQSVGTIRKQLQESGEIIQAEPIIVPGGGVSFRFLFAAANPETASKLAADGLAIEPYRVEPAPVENTPEAAASLTPANLVRVDLGRLDDLMRTVGELVITRARLDNGLGRIASAMSARDREELHETSRAMERQLRDLREGVMRVRLVPIRDLFNRMRFIIRGLAHESGREVDLVAAGGDTEIDKFVVERLSDPLLHLVRNAVSHGLESPLQREGAGKPRRGRIDLRAAAEGGAIAIEVEDDGKGIDSEAVFARARSAGLISADSPANAESLLDLLCTPGFSTRDTADRTSGRGVGMDVVRRAIEELGGELSMASRPGSGTRFTIRLPLTLAIAEAMIVTVGGQSYAIPQAAIREVMQVDPADLTILEQNELLRHRGGVLPLIRLTDLFGCPRSIGTFPAVIVGTAGHATALGADRISGLREVVVHPLADPLVQVRGFSGATELGDGRAVLILDVAGLLRQYRSRGRPGRS